MARRKKPGTKKGGRPATSSSPGGDYSQWLMLVPKDKRYEVADFIRQNPIKDYDDLITFNCQIMAALMEGRITPVVATELRHWHELNFSVIAAKNSMRGTPEDAYTDVITALVQVKRESKKLRGDYFDAEAELVESAPERIEVKNG
jgi:hypothetical protein